MRTFYIAIFLLMLTCLFFSCRKNKISSITTYSVDNVLMYSANFQGSIVLDGNNPIDSVGFCWSTNSTPSIKDSLIIFSFSKETFSCPIKNLKENTTYYVRTVAFNEKNVAYGNILEFKTWDGRLKDFDGNEYKGVQIGNQGWMAENLKSTHYSDGTVISRGCPANRAYYYGQGHDIMPNKEADLNNDGVIDGSDSLIYVNKYGLLYTWYAANNISSTSCDNDIEMKVAQMSNDVCPAGWHVPSITEWETLISYILRNNGYNYEELPLQLKSITGWNDVNGIDQYGLNVLPGGYWREPTSSHFVSLGNSSFFWTSSELNSANGNNVRIEERFSTGSVGKQLYGFSVRCIKDQ
jgi:uncharacterized protein (TIGR02145 family)